MANSINTKVLRLLDANANRAREALRTLEDYCRFVLNNDGLCGELKSIRHDFASANQSWAGLAMLHRDTQGDVGTTLSTASEMNRTNIASVIIAAGKRLGEALRVIEEFAKTFDETSAAAIEAIRYRFYTLEQKINRTLKTSDRFASVRLYVLITQSSCRHPWLDTAVAAIRGGADALQLREKELESGELLQRAKTLRELCRNNQVLLIINDRPDIALLSDADGVHVGQGDLPAIEARKIVGPDKLVGVSTHEISQAKQALLDGADYIGVGPIFRSRTKPREMIPGLDYAKQAIESVKIPAVAIAGIALTNVDQVVAAGIQCVAVTAAITESEDVEQAARQLKARMMAVK